METKRHNKHTEAENHIDNNDNNNKDKLDVDINNSSDVEKNESNNEMNEDKNIELEFTNLQAKYSKLQSDYDELSSTYNIVNTKFLSFTKAYTEVNKRCDELKAEMDQYKQAQRDGAKIEVVSMLFGLHNNIRVILTEDENNILIKMMQSEIENLFSLWNIEIISPSIGDLFDPKDFRIVSSQNTDDEGKKNRISKLISAGYKMSSKLIKAADVEIFV